MSVNALDDVIQCQRELLAALDARDVARLEAACSNLAAAVQSAKSVDVWEDQAETRAKLDYGLKQSAAARTRVNILTEWTSQKIDRLAELRGITTPSVYTNPRNR
jgi:hypothetical protein